MFDGRNNRFTSQRPVTYGRRGMTATSQPLAAQAGMEILQKGGNAVDAAVAMAAALTVVEPTSNGIGGDNFAILWMKDGIHGMQASGSAPFALSPEVLRSKGHETMPKFGWAPVTVPGVPAGWAALVKSHGRLPLKTVLAPAIRLAEEGFPVSPVVGKYWARAFDIYKEALKGPEYAAWFETFAPKGQPPAVGSIVTLPDHARTLKAIADSEGQAFYKGALADAMVEASKTQGGYLRQEDLDAFSVKWVEPLSVEYRGHTVWELPPHGQGISALMALKILEGVPLEGRSEEEICHLKMEALKLAQVDTLAHVTDARHMKVTPEELLDPDYIAGRRALLGEKALDPAPGAPRRGGTVYLAAGDGDGNLVSMIQSNYYGFGSGIVVPGTGIAMNNRGFEFHLEEDHINVLAPGKKPMNTIIPGFLSKDGKPLGAFGVMGGYMQPQGHLQVVSNLLDHGMNPQEALDAWRWQWIKGRTIQVEPDFPNPLAVALAGRGHEILPQLDTGGFGRGQIILRDPEGTLVGGTEKRCDGAVLAW